MPLEPMKRRKTDRVWRSTKRNAKRKNKNNYVPGADRRRNRRSLEIPPNEPFDTITDDAMRDDSGGD